MKFMERVKTPKGEGLAIGYVTGGGICVSVREGDTGAGQNLLFGWCEAHQEAYAFKGGQCTQCWQRIFNTDYTD